MRDAFEMIAKTFFGLEQVLAEELAGMGAQQVRIGSAGHVADDSYFAILPGVERRVRLTPHGRVHGAPIVVEALNDPRVLVLAPERRELDAETAVYRDSLASSVARGTA